MLRVSDPGGCFGSIIGCLVGLIVGGIYNRFVGWGGGNPIDISIFGGFFGVIVGGTI